MKNILYVCLCLMLLTVPVNLAYAKDPLRVVGSSTIYPFSSYVAEEFGATTSYPTPIVESTGSGGGMKIFSENKNVDIVNSSRKMKLSEYKRCKSNGVNKIIEIKFGYDGIVLAQNKKNEALNLSRKEIVLALAAKIPKNGKLKNNPHNYWNQVSADLPKRKIIVYGPPTTSGTRDALETLVFEHATKNMDGYDSKYTKIRTDGKYVPSGENDNLLVERLERSKKAMAIFGYSFLENSSQIEAITINGVHPKPKKIANHKYPISRSLFFYIKGAHLEKEKGMNKFIDLFLSKRMISDFGYLKSLGLISLPEEKRQEMVKRVKNKIILKKDDLKGE